MTALSGCTSASVIATRGVVANGFQLAAVGLRVLQVPRCNQNQNVRYRDQNSRFPGSRSFHTQSTPRRFWNSKSSNDSQTGTKETKSGGSGPNNGITTSKTPNTDSVNATHNSKSAAVSTNLQPKRTPQRPKRSLASSISRGILNGFKSAAPALARVGKFAGKAAENERRNPASSNRGKKGGDPSAAILQGLAVFGHAADVLPRVIDAWEGKTVIQR
jgi:hypothetical protein